MHQGEGQPLRPAALRIADASPGQLLLEGFPFPGVVFCIRDTSLSLLFLPSMGRGWSRAPSCPRQEGNCVRGESDLGKEAGLELNSTLLPHSHHAPPQGSPPGPLGPFASWEVALRGLSGSVLSKRTSFLTWAPGQAAPPSSPWRPCTIASIWVAVERGGGGGGCGGGLTLLLPWLQRIPSF